MKAKPNFAGLEVFLWIWFSQLLSLFGNALTRFAVTIWAYQQTGQVTTLALLSFFNSGAYVLFSPLAGALVDRWNRKQVMVVANLGAALVTAGQLVLYFSGHLQIWHLYLGGVLGNALGAFQEPALTASVSVLVPKPQLTRANGLLAVATDGSRVFAPMLAGLLLALIGVGGVMAADVATCLVAVLMVLALRIPQPPVSAEGQAARGSLPQEMAFGFRYIARRPGLLGLLLIFTAVNLFSALTYLGVLPAMILARSGGQEVALGVVQSVLAVGGVAGGVLLSVWGGPKNRVGGFLLATAASFLLGDSLFAVGQTLPVWILAAFLSALFIPMIISCYEAIWQARVPLDLQGRVLAAKNMVQIGSMPLGYLAAGWLADRVFEPAMAVGRPLAGAFGRWVGTGPGAGMGLMFACTCGLGVLTGLSGFLIPAVRQADAEPAAPGELAPA